MRAGRVDYVRRWAAVLTLSTVVGLAGGLGAVLFRLFINQSRHIFFGLILPRITLEVYGYNLGYILLPAIGSLVAAPFIIKFPELQGNGIPEVMESVIFKGGHMSGSFSLMKILATSITIGSGGSAGREGPIGSIGASLASLIGKWFGLSPEMRKLLTTCGLAAGIAGTFNTPLAGAMFALEVVYMGAFSINLVPIFFAAITGHAVTRAILGRSFEVTLPWLLSYSHTELIFFFILGVLLGILSAAYVKFLYALSDRLGGKGVSTLVLAGLGVGAIGMFFPQYGIFGIGYDGMTLALYGLLPLSFLLILGVAKMIATALTLSSGNSGGIFAPSLYIGTVFGMAFGMILHLLMPSLSTNPSVYALAGMAAFFSGVAQAPLTQILMITELTRSYALLPAIMTSATVSFLAARFFLNGDSVYTLKLKRKGFHLKTGKPIILETIPVKEIMTDEPVYVHEWNTLLDVEKLVGETGHDCFPVVDEKLEVVGVVGIKDLIRRRDSMKGLQVREVLEGPYAVVYPDETAETAFRRLMEYSQNLLPVVESPESRRLVGVVTKRDIYRAYYMGIEGMYLE
ncbi:chloride channel protein [Thermococcus sp.]